MQKREWTEEEHKGAAWLINLQCLVIIQEEELEEARELFQILYDSREMKLYIDQDGSYGKRVSAWLARNTPEVSNEG